MNVLNVKKNTVVCICCMLLFIAFSLFAGERDAKKDFIKESIDGKTRVIKAFDAASDGFAGLSLCALDFVYTNYALLADDEDFIVLARETVKKSSAAFGMETTELLEKIFAVNKDPFLQRDILENFALAAGSPDFKPPATTVQSVNSYAANLAASVRRNSASDLDKEILVFALDALGKFRHLSSFSVLFSCYAFSDKTLSEKAAEALNNFAGIYEQPVRSLILSGNLHEKRLILDLVLKSPNNSDFFKAEMSEKVLSATTYKTGSVETLDREYTALKMQAVRELYRVSWTRSTPLMRDVFISSCKEYEAGLLNDNQFIEIIYAFTRLASSEAVEHLTKYLKTLNKNREENKPCSTPVVLAVIQSLQLLGDKTAFDDLLYATYQTYPEEVISAARDALSKLKW